MWKNSHASVDLPTIAAIAVVVWVLVSLLHEGMGHGLACMLVGGQPLAMSTTEFNCGNVAGWQYKVVVAAGSIANLALVAVGMALARFLKNPSPTFLYFLWLFVSANIFHAGSYIMIGPFTGYGDWSHFVQGFEPAFIWKLLLTVAGYGICHLGMRIAALPTWQPLIGSEAEERKQRFHLLTRLPLATIVVVSVLAGLLSPLRFEGALFTSLLAPAVLIWLVNTPWWPRSDRPVPGVPLTRNWPFLVAGVACLLIFVGVFGPGLGSFANYEGALP